MKAEMDTLVNQSRRRQGKLGDRCFELTGSGPGRMRTGVRGIWFF